MRSGMLGGSPMRGGMIGGMPMLGGGGGGGGGASMGGRVGPAFSGVPLTEKVGTGARGPLGGMPMGAAANQNKKEKGGEASFFAEVVDLDDRYMAEQRREEKLRQFR